MKIGTANGYLIVTVIVVLTAVTIVVTMVCNSSYMRMRKRVSGEASSAVA